MIRHEEIKKDAIPYLMPTPNGLTFYPQYYLKSIGLWLNHVERWIAVDGKQYWKHYMNDHDYVYWPNNALGKARDLFFEPHHKMAALNFLKIIVLPALGFAALLT